MPKAKVTMTTCSHCGGSTPLVANVCVKCAEPNEGAQTMNAVFDFTRIGGTISRAESGHGAMKVSVNEIPVCQLSTGKSGIEIGEISDVARFCIDVLNMREAVIKGTRPGPEKLFEKAAQAGVIVSEKRSFFDRQYDFQHPEFGGLAQITVLRWGRVITNAHLATVELADFFRGLLELSPVLFWARRLSGQGEAELRQSLAARKGH
jgi:hypothetical protein